MAAGLGLALWGVEYTAGTGGAVVRVFLDLPGNDATACAPGRPEVDVDQCARFSRHFSVGLDAEDIVPGRYVLEVSSPGLERVFFAPRQLLPYIGRELALQLHRPLAGQQDPWFADRKRLKAILRQVDGDVLGLEAEGRTFAVTFEQLKQCRLVHVFVTPAKPGGKKKQPGGDAEYPSEWLQENAS